MVNSTKLTLWALVVFMALGVAAYVAGCGSDGTTDAGSGGGGDVGGDVGGGSEGEDDAGGGPYDAGVTTKCTTEGETCSAPGVQGECVNTVNTVFECLAPCATPGAACSAGFCYVKGLGKLYCHTTGTFDVGAQCQSWLACRWGYQCLITSGSTGVCAKVCAGDTDCTSPATCKDTQKGYKTCK